MISVAMITMNEQEAVGKVLERILMVLSDAEVLIVDSSNDNTPQIAQSLGAKVIRQYPPQGYGKAMDLALRSATGDLVVTLDCDDTYPAEIIPDITRYVLEEGYDVVDCSRLEKRPKTMPLSHYLGNKVFAWFASLLFWRRFTDLHSGMRVYRKSVIDSMEFDSSGAALPVELLLKPIRYGYKVKTVFIDYHERVGESTVRGGETSWWTTKRILKVRFGRRPEPNR
jgi:glycosyltransferase involved in cell wall biosynthesis